MQRAKATINQPLPYMQRFVRAANGKVIAVRSGARWILKFHRS